MLASESTLLVHVTRLQGVPLRNASEAHGRFVRREVLHGRRGKRRTLHALGKARRLGDALRQRVEALANDVLFEAAVKLDFEGFQVALGEILRAYEVVELGGYVNLHFHQLILQFLALFSLD